MSLPPQQPKFSSCERERRQSFDNPSQLTLPNSLRAQFLVLFDGASPCLIQQVYVPKRSRIRFRKVTDLRTFLGEARW
jgi:hypothetical protein